MKKKRVLVTGASGFIGQHLTRELSGQGASVYSLDMSRAFSSHYKKEYIGKLEEKKFVEQAIRDCKPEYVFHLAAFKARSIDFKDFYNAVSTNLLGSLNLFSALHTAHSVHKIVVVGTAEEYGSKTKPFHEDMREQPVSAYSYSKVCQSHLCQILSNLYSMPFVVIRPTLAYGPGQQTDMFLPSLITSIINNEPFLMSPGDQLRDYIYVTDVVDAFIQAAVCPLKDGEIINIGGGEPITLKVLARMVESSLNKKDLVRLGARPYRPAEIMKYKSDLTAASKLLKWQPKVRIEQGLRSTIDYYVRAHNK